MKTLILATDGVGLRNFLFTDSLEQGKSRNHDICYWNHTKYPIAANYNCNEIELPISNNHPLSDLYHNAKKQIELRLSFKRSHNEIKGEISNDPLVILAKQGYNIIITPHIAGCTHESMHMTEDFVTNLFINSLAVENE